jgi:putative transposase
MVMSVAYQEPGLAGAAIGEPAGDGDGAGRGGAGRVPLRELMGDGLLDALLERSRDEAGGLRLTGEGSVLGELVRAVLERALEAELTAQRGDAGGTQTQHSVSVPASVLGTS